MENYWIILLVPIVWFLGTFMYQLGNLFYLWMKHQMIKINIWLEEIR